MTQFASRSEHELGMLVRSPLSAANAVLASSDAAHAARMLVLTFILNSFRGLPSD
jgi:hypothetical protein